MKLSQSDILSLIEDSSLDWRKENVVGKCPKCGCKEFGISLKENHLFGCYRKNKCGFSGNIFVLLKYLGKWGDYIGGEDTYRVTEGRLVDKITKVQQEVVDLSLPTINPPLGWRRIYYHEKLEERQFEDSDYSKFEVGVTQLDSKLKDYFIFLLRQKGEIKGYVSRHILETEELKLLNEKRKSQGLKKIPKYCNSLSQFSKLLGGEGELSSNTETVILVEGLFDKRGVDRLLDLDSQEEVKCCFTFSCDCSIEQIYKLQQFSSIKQIILLYDPDVIHKIIKTSFELLHFFPEVLIGYSNSGKDPDKMTLEDLEEVFSTLTNPETFSIQKVKRKALK